jgi:DNA-binding transcriptional MerR regulator
MNHAPEGLLSIGRFARATRLSLKALRLYARRGILKPCYVDARSGYRYYHTSQIRDARLIRTLRELDMPLAAVRLVLAATPAEAERLVLAYEDALERRMAQTRRMVQDVVTILRQEVSMTLTVNMRTAPAQLILSITQRVKVPELDEHIRTSLETLYALIDEEGSRAAGAAFGIYHGPINHQDDGPIEVCVPLEDTIAARGAAQVRTLPGGPVACVALRGAQCDFPEVLTGYDAVVDWMRQNGHQAAGAPREIWYAAPGPDAHMEVAWPCEAGSGSRQPGAGG